MNFDLQKLERLQDRLDAAIAAAERTRERYSDLARAAEFKHHTLTRSARPSDAKPPGRFTTTREREADDFVKAYAANPREVLAQFKAETPQHHLTALMQDHQDTLDELARHQHRLREHTDEIARLNPTVATCRQFLRNLTA